MMNAEVAKVVPVFDAGFVNSEIIPVVRFSKGSTSDSDAGYTTPVNDAATGTEGSSPGGASDAAKANTTSASEADVDLKQRVTAQIEYYFSDENLLKDSFLLKHINRNKQGYVSLKLVASLRKIKSLTKDWEAVLEAAKSSSLLQVNHENTKICRNSPPPQIDMSHVSKTLVASRLPTDDLTVSKLEGIFGKFGGLQHVRILQPGKAVPIDVKKYKSVHPEIGKGLCAIIEYDTAEAARTAQQQLDTSQNWRQDMCVQLLDRETVEPADNKPAAEDDKKKAKAFPTKQLEPLDAESKAKTQRQERVRQKKIVLPSSTTDYSAKRFLTSSALDVTDTASDSGLSCSSSNSVPSPCPSPDHRSRQQQRTDQRPAVYRLRLNGGGAGRGCGTSVVRQPLGPDGSRGFRHLQTV